MGLRTRRRPAVLTASLTLLTAAVTATLVAPGAMAAQARDAASAAASGSAATGTSAATATLTDSATATTTGAAATTTATTAAGAAPATDMGGATPNSFNGVNWADPRNGNFVDGPVIPSGLDTSDSYSVVYNITKDVVAGFRKNLGANTLRLPVNPQSVGPSSSWWGSYRAVIDAATHSGFKVILSYWDKQEPSDGVIDDVTAWNQMWDTLTTTYANNPLVYFEPMNEPYGYTDDQWIQICTTWLADHPAIPRGRVVISGAGYNDHVTTVGAAPALDGTLLSLHFYGFWGTYTTEADWLANLEPRLGAYSSRTIIDEVGEPMTTGLDYSQGDGNVYTANFDATANYARTHHMGLAYWPGLRAGDSYSMETLEPDGTMVNNDTSGVAELKWGYGF